MNHSNVQSKGGVTLVGGGNPAASDIVNSVALAPIVVAADGGANFCVAAKVAPTAIIGDLDSVTDKARAALPQARIIEITEQDSTDFEKCLTRIEAPFVIATGFTGKRLDHTLVAMSVLARKIGPPAVVIGNSEVIFAAPARIELEVQKGTRVSLFPMGPVSGRSTGLRWPIDALKFDPMGRTGTSNIAEGKVTLEFDVGGCLVLIPKEFLIQSIAAITG